MDTLKVLNDPLNDVLFETVANEDLANDENQALPLGRQTFVTCNDE